MVVLGLAVAASLAGALALGRVTGPQEVVPDSTPTNTLGPISAPTTTTTLAKSKGTRPIPDIATGERLTWFSAPQRGSFWPLDLVEYGQALYLFGIPKVPYVQNRDAGLRAWKSKDGIAWESLGEIIGTEYSASSVVATDRGMLVLGSRISDGAPFIWHSAEGFDWELTGLPFDQDTSPGIVHRLTGAAAFDGGLVVLGGLHTDGVGLLSEVLPDEIDVEELAHGLVRPWGARSGNRIVVYGPLGLVGFSATVGDLGFDDETARRLFDPVTPHRSYAWTSRDGQTWIRHEVDMHIVNGAWSGPDGTIVASGFDSYGPTTWTSGDGRSWEARRSSPGFGLGPLELRDSWGELLVASDYQSELYSSRNGRAWESLMTGELIPGQLGGSMSPLAAGSGGLAAIATTWSNSAVPAVPTVIEKDGYVVTIDVESESLSLARPDGRTTTIELWANEPSDLVSVDFMGRHVTFKDPENGEVVVSLDFLTLQRAASAAVGSELGSEKVLLFTPDGTSWTVQPLTREIRPHSEITHIAVLEDRVVILTYSPAELGAFGQPPHIAIRVGVLSPAETG